MPFATRQAGDSDSDARHGRGFVQAGADIAESQWW